MAVHWDVIIVGGRCAGAPTAMLLARAGLDVLLVDAARPGKEPVSTLMIQPRGISLLISWGLGGVLTSSAVPSLRRLEHHLDDICVAGDIRDADGIAASAPRRGQLDEALMHAAAAAGATVYRQSKVREVLFDNGRATGVVLAHGGAASSMHTCDLLVGADGVRSTVANAVGAAFETNDGSITTAHYAYLPSDDETVLLHETEGVLVTFIPTSDGQAVVATYRRHNDRTLVGDVRELYASTVAGIPAIIDRLDEVPAGVSLEGFSGVRRQPNYFRQAAGPGWVLLGDAAHARDSVSAQGISEAFYQADCVSTLIANHHGSSTLDKVLREWWVREHDRLMPAYLSTMAFASLRVTDSRRHFLHEVLSHGNMDQYARAIGDGTMQALLEALDSNAH